MELIYCMWNIYGDEARIYQTDSGRYTYTIEADPTSRTWLTLEEVTNILYKHGFRF